MPSRILRGIKLGARGASSVSPCFPLTPPTLNCIGVARKKVGRISAWHWAMKKSRTRFLFPVCRDFFSGESWNYWPFLIPHLYLTFTGHGKNCRTWWPNPLIYRVQKRYTRLYSADELFFVILTESENIRLSSGRGPSYYSGGKVPLLILNSVLCNSGVDVDIVNFQNFQTLLDFVL